MAESATPAYITTLIRHFADLRDGTHGGSSSREDKEAHFEEAAQLLAPGARQALTELNTSSLLAARQRTETGRRPTGYGPTPPSRAWPWHVPPAAAGRGTL